MNTTNAYRVSVPGTEISDYISSSSQIRARKLVRKKYGLAFNKKVILIPVKSC